jgi:hypothetical protein
MPPAIHNKITVSAVAAFLANGLVGSAIKLAIGEPKPKAAMVAVLVFCKNSLLFHRFFIAIKIK